MKVGFLIPSMAGAGAEKIAAAFSYSLPEGWEPVFILFEDVVEIPFKGRKIVLGFPRQKSALADTLNLHRRMDAFRRVCEKECFDAVISFDDYANILNAAVCRNSILAVHKSLDMADQLKPLHKRLAAKALRRIYYPKARFLTGVSKGICEEFAASFPSVKGKVVLLPNPYDIYAIRKAGAEEPEVEISGDFIINVGRHDLQKGQWHLLRAFREVHKEFPALKLVLVGRGPLHAELIKLSRECGLEDAVVFIEKRLGNVYPLMKKAKLFVLSSLFEGFPNVLVESLALEVPIVSTDCKTGPSEILGKEKKQVAAGAKLMECGLLTRRMEGKVLGAAAPLTEGEKALVSAITYALREKGLLAKLSANCGKQALKFDKSKAVEVLIGLLECCVKD